MSDKLCARCNGTLIVRRIIFSTYSAGHSEEDAPCPDCCIVVTKAALRAVATDMESFVKGNMHASPMYLDHWATTLRHLTGEAVDITPMVQGKLDAIVDAHDQREALKADLDYMEKKMARALHIEESA